MKGKGAYAEGRRKVTQSEQHVHSFLEGILFMVASFTICMNWDQFLALVGVGNEPARFKLVPKHRPLSGGYASRILAAMLATVSTRRWTRIRSQPSTTKTLPADDIGSTEEQDNEASEAGARWWGGNRV